MRHRVRVENPHLSSMAAGVLLTRQLQEHERTRWVEFRAAYLARVMEKYGRLWCQYCGRSGLVADLPEDATKSQLRNLATLDHILPRSLGGAEYDEDNLVVACYTCNQRKADMKWVPFHFEGNMWFGMVHGPKEWAELIETYAKQNTTVAELMGARECPRDTVRQKDWPPKYGFAIECDGSKTLGKFFEENGMPGFVMVRDEKKVEGS